jgi:hypothetical protein
MDDYDIVTEVGALPQTLTAQTRAAITARLNLLWLKVKPIDSPEISAFRERDIPFIAATLELSFLNGQPTITVPNKYNTTWNFLKHGSIAHKAIENLELEIWDAVQNAGG